MYMHSKLKGNSIPGSLSQISSCEHYLPSTHLHLHRTYTHQVLPHDLYFNGQVLVSYLVRTANELAKRANTLERSVASSKRLIFQRVEYKPTEVHVHQRGSLLLCVLGSWNYTEIASVPRPSPLRVDLRF